MTFSYDILIFTRIFISARILFRVFEYSRALCSLARTIVAYNTIRVYYSPLKKVRTCEIYSSHPKLNEYF